MGGARASERASESPSERRAERASRRAAVGESNKSQTHIVGQAELLEVPQALELGRVDDRDAGRLQIKVACGC